MTRMVFCRILEKEAEGLDSIPFPGEVGQRIYDNVSKEGWLEWLKRLTMIINENRLSTADPESLSIIEQHMLGFLFKEGESGQLPPGFSAAGGKK